MTTRLAILLSFLAIASFAIGCGSGGGADGTFVVASEGGTVTSDDGNLTIEIPPGALTEDTEIAVISIPVEEAPEQLRALASSDTAYGLKPEGLEFEIPAVAQLRVDPDSADNGTKTIPAYALFIQGKDSPAELLHELETDATSEDGSVLVTGQLSHFSYLIQYEPELEVILEKRPRQMLVGTRDVISVEARNTHVTYGSMFGIPEALVTITGLNATFFTTGPLVIDRVVGDGCQGTRCDLGFASSLGDLSTFLTGAVVTIRCGAVGLASYNIIGSGMTEVLFPMQRAREHDRTIGPYRILLGQVIECVAPTPTPTPTPTPSPEDTISEPTPTPTPPPPPPPQPTPTPTPQPTAPPPPPPPPSGPPSVSFSCPSSSPNGTTRDVIVTGKNFPPGQSGSATVTGPVGEWNWDFTVGADGTWMVIFQVNSWGTMDVKITSPITLNTSFVANEAGCN